MDNLWTWTHWDDKVSETISVCGMLSVKVMHLSSRLPSLGLMKLCSHAGEVVAYKVQQVQYYKFV